VLDCFTDGDAGSLPYFPGRARRELSKLSVAPLSVVVLCFRARTRPRVVCQDKVDVALAGDRGSYQPVHSECHAGRSSLMAGEEPNDVATWLYTTRPIRWLYSKRGVWLIAILVGATTFLWINGTTGNLLGAAVVADYQLLTQGRTTSGTVTGLDLSNHDSCSYTYRVAGRTFSATEEACGGGRSVGSSLTVTYVPSHPEFATYGDPDSEFWQRLLLSYGVPLFFALFMGFGWKRFARSKVLNPLMTTPSERRNTRSDL